MKPESMDSRAWDIIFANLKDSVGDAWGDYIFALSEDPVWFTVPGSIWHFHIPAAF